MSPCVFGLVVVLVAAWVLRRVVVKIFLWLAVALLVGVGVPAVVLAVLFLVARFGGAH